MWPTCAAFTIETHVMSDCNPNRRGILGLKFPFGIATKIAVTRIKDEFGKYQIGDPITGMGHQ